MDASRVHHAARLATSCATPPASPRRRLLERVVDGAAGPADAGLVGRRARGDRARRRRCCPSSAPATEAVGSITGAFAEATGLDPSTVVAIGCGDEMAATLGAGVYAPGDVCDVVGTAEPVCAASAEPREDPTMLVECHPHADPDAWLLENPGFVSGGNLRWWRDQFAPIERDAEAVGLGRCVRLPVDRGRPRRAGRRGARVPAVHAGRDGARVERRRPRRLLRAHARAHARSHDARDPRGERVRAARHPRRDARRRASTCGGSRSSAAARRGRCGGRSRPT